ncbi:MAG: tetratricopeptide repeat protein [Elusimicrobia bacterium]|nr:tetratricopeptide repeat protein [Elusimicrobiota bacterium]
MKKILFYSVFLLSCSYAGAYEKIEFKGQITNSAMVKPSAVATAEGRIFVADTKANAVFIFDPAGKLLNKTKAPLATPSGISFGNGKLYVAESDASKIAVLDSEGNALWQFSGSGSAPGQLDSPMGVAFGPDERLYVADTGNARVEIFNSDGIFLYGFPVFKGGNAKFKLSKIVADRAGFIYVSSPDQALIQKYDRTGRLVKEYSMENNAMTVSEYGVVYVVNGKEGKVRELDQNGEVAGTFGTRGKGKSEFLKLSDITLDAAGLLYLCDEGNKKVSIINLEGQLPEMKLEKAAAAGRFNIKGPSSKYAFKAEAFVVRPNGAIVAWLPEGREAARIDASGKKTLLRQGKEQGQVKNPAGFASDSAGRLYVADTGNDRLQIFDASDTFVNSFGESGSKEGNFDSPSGLAVSSKGNIYIADTGNKRMQAFNSDGFFLFTAGPKIGGIILQKPISVSLDNNRNVYILDAGLKKVIVTDASGKFLRIWEDSGDLQNPVALAYDGKGYFYILDKGASNVKVFDENGKFTASFFAKGKGERELLDPQYLAVRGNTLYISDKEGARILAFSLDYIPEAPLLAASVEGAAVKLSWQTKAGPWIKKFVLYRANNPDVEPKLVASPVKPEYSDSGLALNATYYYSVVSVSVTGSTGEMSEPVEVFLEGPQEPAERVQVQSASADGSYTGDAKNMAPMEIVPTELNYIFSANYKHYLKNPVGRVTVKNNTDTAFSNVKLSFYFKDFMDFPTDTVVPEIGPKATAKVDLMATLNNRILSITEDTPVQCQLTLTYYMDGQEKTFQLNKPVKVLSKNAIVWDRAERMGNFITPKDTPVFAFDRYALSNKKKFEKESDLLNENLVTALMVWEALGEHGVSYLSDPTNPYAAIKSSSAKDLSLDTVQFPRTTLKLRSGDCDDLTALFTSMLEASGVHTALLDYPAHISMMFDTGASEAKEVGIPEEYLINYNNTWWVGLETTMVGTNIYDAIVHQADMYKKAGADVRIIDTHAAWSEFEPVTLAETGDEKYDLPNLAERVTGAVDVLMKARYEYFKKYYGNVLRENPSDLDANLNLGILAGQYKDYDEGIKRLNKVLEKDPKNAAAINNLGNISFSLGKYDEARAFYMKAAKADSYDGDIWLNLARTAVKTGNQDDVRTFVDRAAKINPDLKDIGDKLAK